VALPVRGSSQEFGLNRIIFIIVITLAIAMGLLMGTLNSDRVSVDLLWIQFEWPLGLLVLSVLFAGLFLGLGLLWFFTILPLRVQLRKLRNEKQSLSAGPDSSGMPKNING
jgi:uncharacterized integral membrane protein